MKCRVLLISKGDIKPSLVVAVLEVIERLRQVNVKFKLPESYSMSSSLV